jgi:HAD superfamily hydrolase (TIGR01450 family)
MRVNLLVDLSGTLHIGDEVCAGAIAALTRIRRATAVPPYTVQLRFCSNTTKESTNDLQARLQRAGFSSDLIPKTSILTSLEACKKLAINEAWKPLLLLTRSAQSAFKEDEKLKKDAFYPKVDVPPSKMNSEEKKRLQQCNTVIVGLAPELFGAEWMDEAFRILSSEYLEGEKNFVATHRALYYRPATSAPLSLGPGAYVAALEAACHRSSQDTIVCGKPSRTFFEACLESFRIEYEQGEKERNIIIGDDVNADLGGAAIEMGFERILVQTGKYRKGDETDSVKVFPTFADFIDQELFSKSILR